MKSRFLILAGAAALAVGCGEEPRPRPVTPVILVSLDTLRADSLTPYGSERDNSPFLQALSREGVVFENCFAQSTSTGPSHRSLFTGQFVRRHGQSMYEFFRSPYVLAGLLRAAGYETAGFAGGGYLAASLGFDQGFDHYLADQEVAGRQEDAIRGLAQVLPPAREWLQRRLESARPGPFFLFLHTYDTHCPYWPDFRWRTRYGVGFRSALNLAALCGKEAWAPFFEDGKDLSAEDRDYLRSMYYGDVAMTDSRLGAFLEQLRLAGVLDGALLIVTSDHGESLGEHRWVGHTLMWEEQLRVPLIVRFPAAQWAGRRVDEPVMLVDLLPTVLDYLGLAVPPGVQGESLLPVLKGERSWKSGGGWERMILAEHQGLSSVRFDQRFKAIFREGEDGAISEARLYDLQEDPGETRDLAGSPAGDERLREILARYREWRDEAAREDRRYRGSPIEGAVDEDLADQLTELGYTGFRKD